MATTLAGEEKVEKYGGGQMRDEMSDGFYISFPPVCDHPRSHAWRVEGTCGGPKGGQGYLADNLKIIPIFNNHRFGDGMDRAGKRPLPPARLYRAFPEHWS